MKYRFCNVPASKIAISDTQKPGALGAKIILFLKGDKAENMASLKSKTNQVLAFSKMTEVSPVPHLRKPSVCS
ncbi:Uncharacterized protein dnm_082370 [Desulfonema magnum]|uniref:Uncharacterized protein n=1 Tax=Desulfonema magnum TaxID=45655 RepID=A0A975BUT9_9BACT|nr:Uncharacterized protein dnm_082370 [Desulfonema magnum]